MTDKPTCAHCGGLMVPGIPGDVYCPNDECFRLDFNAAVVRVRDMKKRERRKQYEKLKKEFGDE